MSAKRSNYDTLLARGHFIWALGESTFFFIMPDFLLLPSVIAKPKLAKRLLINIVLGSAVGTLLLAILCFLWPEAMFAVISHVPFINTGMFDKTASLISDNGAASILYQPISGIPVKIWTYTSINIGYSFLLFFVVVMLARVIRMSIICGVGLVVAKLFSEQIKKYRTVLSVLYAVIFMLMLWKVSR